MTRVSTKTQYTLTQTSSWTIPHIQCTIDTSECTDVGSYRSYASSEWSKVAARGQLSPTTLSLGPSAAFVAVGGSTSTLSGVTNHRWPALNLGQSTYFGESYKLTIPLHFEDEFGSATEIVSGVVDRGPAYTIPQDYFGDIILKTNQQSVVMEASSTPGLPPYIDDSYENLCWRATAVDPSTSCKTGSCIVYAIYAQLTYFAVPTTVSRDMCATAPVDPVMTTGSTSLH